MSPSLVLLAQHRVPSVHGVSPQTFQTLGWQSPLTGPTLASHPSLLQSAEDLVSVVHLDTERKARQTKLQAPNTLLYT